MPLADSWRRYAFALQPLKDILNIIFQRVSLSATRPVEIRQYRIVSVLKTPATLSWLP
jgi:hypothetical protein